MTILRDAGDKALANVSWNNSTRADYYSKAYAKEFEEIEKYVGEMELKLITWEEIEFLLKLRWHEDRPL